MKHCTPSVVCACSSLPFPSFPLFCQCATFQGLLFLGIAVTTIPPLLSRRFGSPRARTFPSGSPCRSEVWKKGDGDGRGGSCQHQVWAGRGGEGEGSVKGSGHCDETEVCVGWPRKRISSTPERKTVYVSSHT